MTPVEYGSTSTASQPAAAAVDTDRLLIELAGMLPGKDIARALARATGESRNALYQRLLELGKESDKPRSQ